MGRLMQQPTELLAVWIPVTEIPLATGQQAVWSKFRWCLVVSIVGWLVGWLVGQSVGCLVQIACLGLCVKSLAWRGDHHGVK